MAPKKKKGATPTNPKLYARVKAEAKRKFAVYPSAYANGWLVRTYKARGGGYRLKKCKESAYDDRIEQSRPGFLGRKRICNYSQRRAEGKPRSHGRSDLVVFGYGPRGFRDLV